MFCFSLHSNAQTLVQEFSIPDDGNAYVPLQFDFPFYGQTFRDSWMFDNGIISFQDPTVSGLAWSSLSVRNFSTNMGSQFDYSIYPLWTDLINIVGTHRTEGNAEFQRYSWLGISPFYDPNRLNTFSVEIRPDGSISANYTLIDVNYASVGIVGNSSAGEFDQIFFSGSTVNTGSISNWERYTLGVQQPVEEPQQQYTSVIETPTVIIVETNTGVEATPIIQQQSVVSESTTPAEIAQTEQTQASGSGINLSRVLNILAREQARIGTLERSTVESSIEQSATQAMQATQDAESIAAGAQAESMTINNSSQSAQETIQILNPIGETRTESSVVAGFTAVDVLQQDTNVSREETQNQQRTETVNRNAPDNELADGVSIASLGAPPVGFNLYSLGMPDGSFYAPREIYRNQRVVDNPRSRRLFGGSDTVHQQMIDQQYNLGR